jgi:4-amino-4-deoxy-L-arabinose transferase-like glycosyltransferase
VSAAPPITPREGAAAAALGVLALLLRVPGIGAEGLWHDESVTFLLADLPFPDVMEAFRSGNQAPLFPLLLRAWKAAFGMSEGALRSLSALAGIAAIPLLWLLGRRLHSPRAGLWAAGLMAASPLAIHYSQELRPYSALMLTVTLAALMVLRLRRKGTWTAACLLGAALAGLALLHHVGTLLAFALVAASMIPWPGRRAALQLLAAGMLAAVAWGAWTFASPEALVEGERMHSEMQEEGALPQRVLRSLSSMTPGTELPVRNRVRGVPPLAWAGLAACAVLAAIGFRRWPKQAAPGGRSLLFGAPALFLMLLPLPELLHTRAWVVGKTDSPLLPLALLAVAAGLASMPVRWALLAGLPLAALAAFPLNHHYGMDHRSQERILARLIYQEAAAGDVVIVTANWHPGLRYYALREEDPPQLRTFPPGLENRSVEPGWERTLGGRTVEEAATSLARELEAEGRKRIWLVLHDRPAYHTMRSALATHFTERARWKAPPPLPVTIHLFEKGSSLSFHHLEGKRGQVSPPCPQLKE